MRQPKFALEPNRVPKGKRNDRMANTVSFIDSVKIKPRLDKLNIPVSSAVEFVDRTNATDGEYGSGATMHLATGRVLQPGKTPGHVVGAEPMDGKPNSRIATHLYGAGSSMPRLSIAQFADEAERIKGLTTHKDSSIGTWYSKDPKQIHKGIQLDASRIFEDVDDAGRAAIARDESATWDNEAIDEISNETHRKRLGIPGTLKTKNKIEIRVPEDAAPGSKKFKGK